VGFAGGEEARAVEAKGGAQETAGIGGVESGGEDGGGGAAEAGAVRSE
jgi:hypothetical protein